ncbi:MAG: SusC/RagA family TonB-linked outer membrane protein, partial [Leadbetterella sp.]|nr:SusC/RagA family TonB-linked outer membrane protein [Leadbetterella sp.]
KAIGTSGFSYGWLAPNLPLYDEETGLAYFHPGNASNTQSPMKQLRSNTNLKNFQFIGSATVGYKIIEDLEAKIDASFTRLDYNGIEKYKSGYFSPYAAIDYDNTAYFGTNYQYTYNIEPQLNYRKKLSSGRLTGLLGTTFQETLGGGQLINADNFSSELLMDNLASASRIYSYSNTYNQYKFQSVFARVTYDHQDKYIVNGTFRRDGSSRFAPDRRFGNFWAVGAAWIASNEDFLKENAPVISFLKLRTSYGLTGNDAISNYMYMETFGATTYPYNYAPGLYANRLGNSQFGWETNYKFEVALELNLFKNRLNTTTAFFNNQGSNQLINYPVATQTGWETYVANLDGALIRNRGVEFEFTSHNIKTSGFNWRSNFNITAYKNTLVKFPNLSASAYSNTYEIGKSINAFRRYEFDRIDPENGTPLVIDQNGDGVFSAIGDYISHGSSDPKFYGGLGNTFSYKGLELDVFFQFVRKPYANGYINSSNASQPGIIFNVPKFLLEGTWENPGDEATRPRLSTQNSGAFFQAYNRYRLSTASLVDGSYTRLKNLTLSYTLPRKVVRSIGLSNLRVYVLGQNLWTITKYEGYDPETPGTVTPPMRVYTLGLNLNL